MPADISSCSRSKHMLLGPPNLSKKIFGWCIKPAPEHTRGIHMRRTCQLPVGELVLPWGVAALVLCALVVPAQIVHAQRAICTLCELRPGNCSPETLAACRGNKGTGETGGGTKSTGTGPTKSGATNNSNNSSNPTKGPSKNTKTGPTLPDVESLTGKSKANEGWGGGRSSDTRTKEQRYPPQAKQTVESLQNLTGGGKPPPEGWGGGLKSDSRTIEQKLDTP